ncbi:microtubule-associated tumor suppressor 1 homolog A isoform X2 [Betta splendens]|nr:microtubule-associated tumor suppressor 1 homolog A isoform X2 [Betta splendens]XP_029020714.1 microtubule-associated tumor suppressor 1 homolog A isoform X2 [Betta splendens]
MSDKTFHVSTHQSERIVSVHHRGLHLGPPPNGQHSNSSTSSLPHSSSSVFNPSDGEGASLPQISMQEYCISEGSPVDNAYSAALTQEDTLSSVSMKLNQTFIATPVNASMNFWNDNLSTMHDQETGSEEYQIFHNTAGESNNLIPSPDSAGMESQSSLCELSRSGSLDNSSYSLSSGEMVIRSNSFCREDQSLLVVSPLDESSPSPAAGHPALPGTSNLLSVTLPDVSEKSPERIAEDSKNHPCLGRTFITTDNCDFLTEENEITSYSLVTLPDENATVFLMTFNCESSSEDGVKEAKFPNEADRMPHFPRAITPEQGKSFVSTLSTMQDTDDIHTSTPVQNMGNMIHSLPSFSESPFTANLSSPGLNPVKQQPVSVTPKEHVFAALQMKRAPNLGVGGIESKVITRTRPQISVPSPLSQFEPSHTGGNQGSANRISPTKAIGGPTLVCTTTKIVSSVDRQVHEEAGNLDMTLIQSSGLTSVDGQDNNGAFPVDGNTNSNVHSSPILGSNPTCEAAQVALSQVVEPSAKHAANQTFCFTSPEKSPNVSGQTDPRPTPKQGMSVKIEVKTGSALGQQKPPVLKTRLRFSSASSPMPRSPKEKRIPASFTIPKAGLHPSQTKAGNLNGSSQNKRATKTEALNRPAENSSTEVKKISLIEESGKSTSQEASWNEGKSRFRRGSSPTPKRETPLSQSLAASHRPASLSTRQKQGTLGRDNCATSRAIPQSKLKNTTGFQKAQATEEPSIGNGSAASTKHQLNGFPTPTRPSLIGRPPTPLLLLRKTPRPSRVLSEAGVPSELGKDAKSTQVSAGAASKPTPFKSLFKPRHISTSGTNTHPTTLTTAIKPPASTSKQVSSATASPLIRTGSARLVCPNPYVDKNKPKAGACQQRSQQQSAQPNQSSRPPGVVPASVAKVERKNHTVQQLQGLLAASHRRFEAMTIVLQQTLAKSEEATRQCRELSQELVNLRGELVCSVHSSERLEKEKEELRVSLDNALQNLQEQHQKDLSEQEERLRAFYQAEWDKVYLTYQVEADKCKSLMQQQIKISFSLLQSSHDAKKLELQSSHAEQLQCIKQQCDMSLEELRKAHSDELQSLETTLKHAEASLSAQIQELTLENNALIEKLTAEENKRKEMAENSQKDSHTLYLEQELESLKVVLEIKNKQLHQQEKKMMEIDTLTEKNVKLDESLKKVQQENEDLKARMEKHAALSRQLSTEQAVLQESLQKESKVNKRLSMENEELLWKLHNGELGSPRKVSPTSTSPLHSPSHSFSLQSPHSSRVFPSSPVSPR